MTKIGKGVNDNTGCKHGANAGKIGDTLEITIASGSDEDSEIISFIGVELDRTRIVEMFILAEVDGTKGVEIEVQEEVELITGSPQYHPLTTTVIDMSADTVSIGGRTYCRGTAHLRIPAGGTGNVGVVVKYSSNTTAERKVHAGLFAI